MKIWNYIGLTIGLVLLFELAGFVQDPLILNAIGYSRVGDVVTFNPTFSNFTESIFSEIANNLGLLIGLGVALVAAGLFAKGKLENFIILPFITGTLLLFVSTFTEILQTSLAGGSIQPWIGIIAMFILGTHSILFMLALVEFFRGTD